MSESAGIRFVKENWWLLIVLAIVIAGAVVLGLRGEDPEPPAEPVQATRPAGTVSSPQVEIAREKPAEMARKQIAIYEEQVKNDPEHEDTVPRLHAAANLYKNKLLDYETAAVKYQVLLLNVKMRGILVHGSKANRRQERAFLISAVLLGCKTFEKTVDFNNKSFVCAFSNQFYGIPCLYG